MTKLSTLPTAYNHYFDIAALVIYIALFAYSLTRTKGDRIQNYIFVLLTANGMLSSIADILTSYGNAPGTTGLLLSLRGVFNYAYLGIHNIQPVLLLLYIFASSELITIYRYRHIAWLCFIPYMIIPVLLIKNIKFENVFYFDDTIKDIPY